MYKYKYVPRNIKAVDSSHGKSSSYWFVLPSYKYRTTALRLDAQADSSAVSCATGFRLLTVSVPQVDTAILIEPQLILCLRSPGGCMRGVVGVSWWQ